MEVVKRKKESCYQLQTKNFIRFIENYKENKIWRHQIDAVLQIKAYFENSKNKIGICVLPTGSGKSGISTMSPYACAARRVLVITPSKKISKQMFDNFCDEKGQSFFVKRGLSTNTEFLDGVRPNCRGVIEKTNDIRLYFNDELVVTKFGTKSSVQINTIPKDGIDFVIVDKAQHYPADTWKEIIDYFSDAKKLFLTATPKNGENDILPNQNQHICFQMEREELVNLGIIRNVVFDDSPSNSPDHP